MAAAEFCYPVRVYYEDTDAGGIVYHVNYLKFFERARTEWFRHLGIEQDVLLERSIGFVVRSIEVENLIPARFNQLLTVKSQLGQLTRTSVTFEQQVLLSTGELVCTGLAKVVCVDLAKMKPIRIPSYIFEVLEIVV